jgi:hypothetical protein
MEGGPLLADWWVALSKDFVPYLNVNAKLADVADQDLLAPMGGRGWPHFVVLDDRGTRIVPGPSQGQFRPMDEASTVAALAGAKDLIALRKSAAAAPEDAAAAANLTMLESLLLEGARDEARLAAARATPGADPVLVLRLAVQDVLQTYSREVAGLAREDAAGRQAAFDRAAKAILGAHRQGPGLFDTRLKVFGDYWRLVFSGALAEGDLELAAEALRVYRHVYGTDSRLRERMDKMEKDLEAARVRAKGAEPGAEPAPGSGAGSGGER